MPAVRRQVVSPLRESIHAPDHDFPSARSRDRIIGWLARPPYGGCPPSLRRLIVQLRALILSAHAGDPAGAVSDGAGSPTPAALASPCIFCGAHSGAWQASCVLNDNDSGAHVDAAPACPLCVLTHRLERPRIDEEAVLIWLPEMSQPAINTLMRHVHMRLRAMGECLHADGGFRLDTPERRTLHHVRAALRRREDLAQHRLGSTAPSVLAGALLRLSPAAYGRRAALLDGLRLLPLGRIFAGDEDVYPRIVDTWIDLETPDRTGAPSPTSTRTLEGS